MVSITHGTIEPYNSLLPREKLQANNNIPLCKTQNFFEPEHKTLYAYSIPFSFHTTFLPGLPKQTSAADCGLFVLHFANAVMKGHAINFTNYPDTICMRQQYVKFCLSQLSQSMRRQIWHHMYLPNW